MILDEEYFRRIEEFEGDTQKFRSWMFDLLVTIGSVDNGLAIEIKKLLKQEHLKEGFLMVMDAGVPSDVYDKYKGELYGLM